jgi:DNA-binding transcriptional ArsR family regulator
MHLIPADRAHRRVIDGHTVCDAIAGIGDPAQVRAWAERFGLLADPGRLTLLLCIRAADEICVSDLAVAAGMNDTATSQALRLLRTAGLVATRKDGRVVRYRLADDTARDLLDRITAPRAPSA